MVILDHVNVNKLNVNSFRHVSCPCELCDCGCFDRMKYKHVSACKRKGQPVKEKLHSAHTSLGCPLSHYKDTFRANPNFRPPSAYIPPPDKYVPQVPMDFNTVQKLEFKPLPLTDRPKAFKIIEQYMPPKEPLEVTSQYQYDYPVMENMPKSEIVKRHPNVQTTVKITDKLSDKTTTKEHYPNWRQTSGPVRAFTEFPSYAGEALFPTSERNFSTTTAAFHPPMLNVKRTKSFIRFENKGSIGMTGSMDMNTNYRNTFIQHLNTERAKPFDPNSKAEMKNSKENMAPMQNMTQTRSDFVHYKNFQRPMPADVDPYVSNLNYQIYPNNIHELTTSYAKEYQGHDPKINPKPHSFKKEPLEYRAPTEKIDAETVTMRDFKPIDVTLVPRLKIIKAAPTLKRIDEPMESQTTSKRHFVKYDVKPITLASDPQPYYYIQSKDKFDCRTTNEDNYYAKATSRVSAFKPEMSSLDRKGSIDFQTNHRNTYIDHGLTMCEAKAYFIAQAMAEKQEQKQEEQEASVSPATTTKKKAPRVPSSTKFTSSKLITQVS